MEEGRSGVAGLFCQLISDILSPRQMVGIDLGTTNSLVAAFVDGRPVVFENELGESLTPSAVAVSEEGRLLVGRAAKDRLVVAPDSGCRFFKRDMGTERRYQFGGNAWSSTELSSVVLREMKRIAELRLQRVVDSAVITVPAYFHDQQRHATMDAAKLAGLRVERIINEPTAAALAYGYQNKDEESTILVFDLGGGTFDVTLLEIFNGVIDIKASSGDSRLGGEDFTDAVFEGLTRKLNLSVPAEDRLRWRERVETAKRRLTKEDGAKLSFGTTECMLTRADFREYTQEVSSRLKPVVMRCLRDGGVEPEQLMDVLMVGGASRTTSVPEFVTEVLKRIPNQKLDADRVVAMGAAVQAALCAQDAAVEEFVLTDVCPHTLGIEIVKHLTPTQIEPGYFSPIIDRNTTVPTSRSLPYTTVHPQQDEVNLHVYQGEARMVKDNQKIGELRVKGLRAKPGQRNPGAVDIRFSYDMNGILEVEVTNLETREKSAKVIEQRPGAMTREQIEEALRKLQPLKVRPRDVPEHAARLERANRVYTELVGPTREEFAQKIAVYESALELQSKEDIKVAAAILDSFMRPFFEFEGEVVK